MYGVHVVVGIEEKKCCKKIEIFDSVSLKGLGVIR